MKLLQVYVLLIFLSLIAKSTAAPKYAKAGCNDTCGDVKIPYPFGIGANCSLNEWYAVDCNSSTPHLSSLNNLEVLNISLGTKRQILNVDLGRSPFIFSSSHNKFVVEGCGEAAIAISLDYRPPTGCSTICRNNTLRDKNKCLGLGCCQITIPYYFKSYMIYVIVLERQGRDGVCGSAFLVDENSYDEGRFSGDNSYVPISLLWTLSASELEITTNDTLVTRIVVDLADDTQECAMCRDGGGYCRYNRIYNDLGDIIDQVFTCSPNRYLPSTHPSNNRSSMGVILGVSISMGVLFLVTVRYGLYNLIKKIKTMRKRKKFFKCNGGLLLKQQEEADPSLVDKTILFTSHELEKATDHFNENRIVGRGGQGTVYKGMLVDGRIVAVKKSKVVDESQLEQFINEVVILSQINHRNVVKLLGCCLETEVPLLVSEFISNGTLYDCIHNEENEFQLSYNMRLQIATEVASALSYLHSATSIPIYHRDIKTTNILLDDKFRAKVSDFGTSRFVSVDQTHLTTLVKGTFGYLDPEYFHSSQFTEKSDVYSFGVVLVELLTGERPISLTRFGENRSLAVHFMLAMEEGRVMSIFDALVIKEGSRDELLALANLAMRCLNMNGKNRPTMKEVAIELETIRSSHVPTMVQTNFRPVAYGEELELSRPTYGESSSTFVSFNDNSSSQKDW
uniref:Protein kinase domain-containing protein n=1 Tax=Lactuca sativa TaxID=4236 RepID=A0A9R1XPW0_LACSA|nr:hypothetical protein LSAT_V11C200072330 [Lactuca sativa]